MKEITKANINDLEEINKIEQLCFPASEAATKKALKERINLELNYFYLLKENNKIISFINGILSDENTLFDEMYENINHHKENGENYIIFGVDTIPEEMHKGNAKYLMNEVINILKKENKEKIILTCKKNKITFYEQFGFINDGISESVHGDAEWYQMTLKLK